MPRRTQIKIAIGLGFLSFVMGVLGHLALTDIFHGEADVSLEWIVLRTAAFVFVVFIIYALIVFRKILRRL